jgi:hypothetical protein
MTRALAVLAGSLTLAIVTVSPAAAQAPATVVPTFTKDVAPILYEHCASCHRPGEIGPMSFLSYESTRPWARAIQQKVVSREMPPWGADPAHSMKMRNDRSLSQQEIDTIVAWVKAGGPKGEPSDMPPAPKFASGWQLGEPDYIFEMPLEWTIKAEGAEAYLYFYQPIPFTEDKMAGHRDPAEQLQDRPPLRRLRRRHPGRLHGEGRLPVRRERQADPANRADGQARQWR